MQGITWARNKKGQTTVEAAYLIPVLLLLILLLLQPMILLYNRMVMENAAAEGCRLLVTATAQGAYSQAKHEGYIQRRLAAIPPVDIFHVHGSSCSWEIVLEGNEYSSEVSVSIVNQVRPLPLVGWGANLLGLTNENNNYVQEVVVTMPTQPSWVETNGGNDPTGWVQNYE
ncbi:MAG: pilus assembly protein [Coriobacteriia bacterium]|nr:pilus assembly protein [Coriobacteriia bacterium]